MFERVDIACSIYQGAFELSTKTLTRAYANRVDNNRKIRGRDAS